MKSTPKSTEIIAAESDIFERFDAKKNHTCTAHRLNDIGATEIGYLHNGIEFRLDGEYYHLKVIRIKPRKKNGHRKHA